jgi:hypothetical protein
MRFLMLYDSLLSSESDKDRLTQRIKQTFLDFVPRHINSPLIVEMNMPI